MSTWSPKDIVRKATPPRSAAKVTVRLEPDEAVHLDEIAADAGCSRDEIARRLLVDVIADDRAAEHGHAGAPT